ncbi:hypothetical protein SNE40_020600 [Patella caerulea]
MGLLLGCNKLCSATVDCRRILYDKETNLCSLYDQGEHCLIDEDVTDKVCYRLQYICGDVDCERCPIGYYGDKCQHVIEDCTDGAQKNVVPKIKGISSFIRPLNSLRVIEVWCDFKFDGWTFILTRDVTNPETNFNRTWKDYANGFGHKEANHWLGLENLHNILQNHPSIKLKMFIRYGSPERSGTGYYHGFYVEDVDDNYRLSISSFDDKTSAPVGDSLINGSYSINGRPFSTYDRDYSNNDCPGRFGSGWWFLDDPVCSRANVNGRRSGDNFESTWHWLDNLGYRTDLLRLTMKFTRVDEEYPIP